MSVSMWMCNVVSKKLENLKLNFRKKQQSFSYTVKKISSVSVAACSGTSGTSLVPFYFESSNFLILYDFSFFCDN